MVVACPICAMELDEKNAFKAEYKGKTYYLCCLSEKKKFDENPEKYIKS
jgi:YHS domain-containing protein